jgi:hypothetical protein
VYYAVVTNTNTCLADTDELAYVAPPSSAPALQPAMQPLSAPPPPLTTSNYDYGSSGELFLQEGFTLERSTRGTQWFALAWFLATLSFQLCCPLEYQPVAHPLVAHALGSLRCNRARPLLVRAGHECLTEGWLVCRPGRAGTVWLSLLPLRACSVGALNNHDDFWKCAVFFTVMLAVYLLYSLPMSYIKHSRVDSSADEDLRWAGPVRGVAHTWPLWGCRALRPKLLQHSFSPHCRHSVSRQVSHLLARVLSCLPPLPSLTACAVW